ncbi:hypothetical protein JYU34_000878 [Plutella xylostella]|uniref:NADP-dependent oxidoreductase domain-containing protein n=1 Tax=Plutella xylostella TaxID=51655 RepID=A0ABQ7R5J1_PLUXY|nr:hypothetical protein JYU34_000878 [Plutella xylostella]
MCVNKIINFKRGLLQMAAAATEAPKWKLNNGLEIPALALGTYLGFDEHGVMTSTNKQLRDTVVSALRLGYRHVDTAAVYQTEAEIGEAIAMCVANGTVRREDVFVTTKLWNTRHGRARVAEALKDSLKKMRLDYVDLYLMHWPVALNEDYSFASIDYLDTWRGLEDVQRRGLARSIGLSNFNRQQVARVIKEGSVKPAVLQIEAHPQIVQQDLVTYAQSEGLIIMGFSPLGSLVSRFGMEAGGPRVDDPTLVEIAAKYNKTTPQVLLRWLIERKIIPIPKTVKQSRLVENLNIFDFHLTPAEVATISAFDSNKRFTFPSFWQNHPHYPFEKIKNPIRDPFGRK